MRRSISPPLASLFLVSAALAACSADPDPIAEGVPRISFSPRTADLTQGESITTEVALSHLMSHGGRSFFASSEALYELRDGQLELRRPYADDGELGAFGTIVGLCPRGTDGLYLATQGGLFALEGRYLVQIFEADDAVTAIANVEQGALSGLWFGTKSALYWRAADRFDAIEVPETSGAVTRLAIQTDGEAALVSRGDRTVILRVIDGELFSDALPFDATTLHAIAAGGSMLFASTDDGLYRRAPDGTWSLFPWTSPVLGALSPGEDDVVLASAEGSLLRFAPDNEVIRFTSPAYLALGPDDRGTAWASQSDGITRLSLGEARSTSYQTELAPWLEAKCGQCHANQTQNFLDFEVFRRVAEEALRRVKQGDMPRCPGGVPCAPGMKLAESEYSILDAWIRDGKQP